MAARPRSALLREPQGFLRDLMAVPAGQTWGHGVEIPIRILKSERLTEEERAYARNNTDILVGKSMNAA